MLRHILIGALVVLAVPPPAWSGDLNRQEAGREYMKMLRERAQQKKPPPTMREIFELYNEETKREWILEDLKAGGGAWWIPERWDYVQDPTTALRQADYDLEPLPSNAVKALERVFPLATDPMERLRLGALLYRYGSKMGWQYLIQEVRDHRNEEAAIILAWNQDEAAWPDLKQFFEASTKPSGELLYVLGRWAPKASTVLSAGFLAGRGYPSDYMKVLALADHKVDQATIERLQKFYRDWKRKVEVAGALVRLQPEQQEPLEYLIGQTEKWQSLSEVEQEILFSTLLSAADPQLQALRLQIATMVVEQYLAQSEAPVIDFVLFHATLEIIAHEGKKGQELGLAMLRKIVGKKGTPEEGKKPQPADITSIYAVAEALVDSGAPDIKRTVNAVLADAAEAMESILLLNREFVATLRAIRKLRELPRRYTPVYSREFVHTPTWFQPAGGVPDLR